MHFRAFSLLVIACVLRAHPCAGQKQETDQRLSKEDEDFCKGSVELSYPDVNIKSCMVIPQEFRERISREWGAPRVQMATADTNAKYVLLMVDPDAPSRTSPTRAYWRHWLLADIEGSALRAGHIKGTLLSDYTRPTPPQSTGFHRYQIELYEQPAGQVPSLSEQEKSSLGNWDPQAFVETFGLVGPVASLQFLTQNYKD